MSVEEFAISTDKLNAYSKQFFVKINKIFYYSFIVCFLLGLGIALQNHQYNLALIMGGVIMAIFYISKAMLAPTSRLHKHIVSIALALYYIQYTLQTEGEFYIRFVYFIFMTALILYEDWRVLTNFFLTGMLINSVVVLANFTGLELQQYGLYTQSVYQEMTQGEGVLVLTLIVSHFVLCLLITHFLKNQTYKNARNAIYLQEQLNIEDNTRLANQIAAGELYGNYELKGNDAMGNALLGMRENLREIQEQEEIKKWQQNGSGIISDVLIESHGITELAENTIASLVKYMKAFQGGFYVLQEAEEGQFTLHMAAHYAYDIPESTSISYQLGEGLVGEAAKRMTTIHLDEVPASYSNITSGLGGSKPNQILIVPLKFQQHVVGVIEISTFEAFKDYEVAFMENISERIATTINTANAKTRTNKLLEESQALNKKLQEQGEKNKNDMKKLSFERQNAERLNQEMKDTLEAFDMNFAIIQYGTDGRILSINENFMYISGYELSDLKGKDHRYITDPEERKSVFYDGFWEELLQGKVRQGVFRRIRKTGEQYWAKAYYAPMLDAKGKVSKMLHVEFDITREQQELNQLEDDKRTAVESQQEMQEDVDSLKTHEKEVLQQLEEITAKYQQKCHLEQELRDDLRKKDIELSVLKK